MGRQETRQLGREVHVTRIVKMAMVCRSDCRWGSFLGTWECARLGDLRAVKIARKDEQLNRCPSTPPVTSRSHGSCIRSCTTPTLLLGVALHSSSDSLVSCMRPCGLCGENVCVPPLTAEGCSNGTYCRTAIRVLLSLTIHP